MINRLFKLFYIFPILLFIFLSFRKFSYAQDNFGYSLTVEPAYQEVEIPEDALSVETKITFKNSSDFAQQIELFAYDFKQSDHFGSVALINGFNGKYLYTLASFLTFEKQNVVVEAHSSEDLVITIKNRQTLSPGGHYAAVVARVVDKSISTQQKILPAISSLLLVRKIGGERIHLSLKEIEWKPKLVVFSIPKKIDLFFENEGNLHIIPRGNLDVKDLFGNVIYQGTINESSLYILPGTLRKIPVKLNQSRVAFPVMLYSLEIDGRSNIGEAIFSSNLSFLYIDQKIVVVVLFLIIVKIWLIIKKRKNEKS